MPNEGETPTAELQRLAATYIHIGPTFRNVLDITLYTSRDAMIENRMVLSTPSFFDHRYIYYSIRNGGTRSSGLAGAEYCWNENKNLLREYKKLMRRT